MKISQSKVASSAQKGANVTRHMIVVHREASTTRFCSAANGATTLLMGKEDLVVLERKAKVSSEHIFTGVDAGLFRGTFTASLSSEPCGGGQAGIDAPGVIRWKVFDLVPPAHLRHQ